MAVVYLKGYNLHPKTPFLPCQLINGLLSGHTPDWFGFIGVA